jgi:hypothetical protein
LFVRRDFVCSKREMSPDRACQIPLQIHGSAFATLGWEARGTGTGRKSRKVKDCRMNSTVVGIDLEDSKSLATVLSPMATFLTASPQFLKSQCSPSEDGVKENGKLSDDVRILISTTGVQWKGRKSMHTT